MPLPPDAATSRWTSFVMSSTVRCGSAAAIETGISTLVIGSPERGDGTNPLPAENAQHFSRPSSGGFSGNLAGQPEVDVLARDGDLLELIPAELCQSRKRRLDQLLGRRRTRGQPDRGVPVEQGRVQLALALDQLGLGTALARHLH